MIRNLLAGAAALAILAGVGSPLPAMALTAAEKTDIEAVVRDYLIRNPEVLLEALDALEAKRAGGERAAQKEAIKSAGTELLASPSGTILGNPEGDVTVVEFFDYNCSFCKRAMSDMEQLIATDPKLRFILKEIPVLGEDSVQAARISLAFRKLAPERYAEFHTKLLGQQGVANEASAIAVARELGVEEPALREALGSPEVVAALAEGTRLAELLKINGTPSYVVGDEVLPGAVGLEILTAKIENVRRCGSANC